MRQSKDWSSEAGSRARLDARYLPSMHALLLGLLACSIEDENPGSPSDDSAGNGGYQSDFSTGKYRLNAFTILGPEEGGRDWDDDGQVDNNLPSLLSLFGNFLQGWDFSKEGLNAIAANACLSLPPLLLAAALAADGRQAEAREVVRHHRLREPQCNRAHAEMLLGHGNASYMQGCSRILSTLEALGITGG